MPPSLVNSTIARKAIYQWSAMLGIIVSVAIVAYSVKPLRSPNNNSSKYACPTDSFEPTPPECWKMLQRGIK
jgi:hypothetical protein